MIWHERGLAERHAGDTRAKDAKASVLRNRSTKPDAFAQFGIVEQKNDSMTSDEVLLDPTQVSAASFVSGLNRASLDFEDRLPRDADGFGELCRADSNESARGADHRARRKAIIVISNQHH